jgi:peptidoglycan/xylan/chitin deacetylase (PgdA/CDA1 family)
MMVLGVMILWFFNKYVYKGFGVQADIIRQGQEHFNQVAITFDDGPDPFYTPYILNILKEHNVPATFFLIGKNVEDFPEIAKRIVEEGHTIGNHTYSHKSLILLSARAAYEQVKKAEKAIEDVTGVRPILFRPPRGVCPAYIQDLLRNERYTIALWDVSSEDWAELPPKKIVSNIVRKVKPGSIILLHDSGDLVTFKGGNRSATVQALPLIIDNLRAKGYDFITVDQMILLSKLMETEEQVYEDNSGENPAY